MPTVYDALTNRMDYLTARQGILAGNIANVNTPGYISKDLQAVKPGQGGSFAMMVTDAHHLKSGGTSGNGKMVEDKQFIQHNGNSVRLDEEMLKMGQTKMDYQLMTQLYTKQMQMQKLALGNRQ